jgi:hypothetical protein
MATATRDARIKGRMETRLLPISQATSKKSRPLQTSSQDRQACAQPRMLRASRSNSRRRSIFSITVTTSLRKMTLPRKSFSCNRLAWSKFSSWPLWSCLESNPRKNVTLRPQWTVPGLPTIRELAIGHERPCEVLHPLDPDSEDARPQA